MVVNKDSHLFPYLPAWAHSRESLPKGREEQASAFVFFFWYFLTIPWPTMRSQGIQELYKGLWEKQSSVAAAPPVFPGVLSYWIVRQQH